MTTTTNQETVELFCNMDAISLEYRDTHQATALRLVTQAFLEIKELEDGYSFKFPSEEYEAITQYIANERRCCSFFTFDLKIAPNQGPIWLSWRGNAQIKAFLTAEFQRIPDLVY